MGKSGIRTGTGIKIRIEINTEDKESGKAVTKIPAEIKDRPTVISTRGEIKSRTEEETATSPNTFINYNHRR